MLMLTQSHLQNAALNYPMPQHHLLIIVAVVNLNHALSAISNWINNIHHFYVYLANRRKRVFLKGKRSFNVNIFFACKFIIIFVKNMKLPKIIEFLLHIYIFYGDSPSQFLLCNFMHFKIIFCNTYFCEMNPSLHYVFINETKGLLSLIS